MNLPISNIVRVQVSSKPIWPEGPGFGTLLLITCHHSIPRGDALRYYTSLSELARCFDVGSNVYRAAEVYFAQEPSPPSLGVARWACQDEPAELLSSASFCNRLEEWRSVKDGCFSIQVGDEHIALSNLDFSHCDTLAAVAEVLDRSLKKNGKNKVSCAFSSRRFVILTQERGTEAKLERPTGGESGTDVAKMMGLSGEKGVILTQGCAAESIAQALTRFKDMSSQWYGFVFLTPLSEQNIGDASTWAQAEKNKIFGYTTGDPNVPLASSNNDVASSLKEKMHRRTIGVYDPSNAYTVISVLAKAFSVDFSQPHSAITLKFKQLPSIEPSLLRQDEIDTLRSKNINYYTKFGKTAILAEGVMADGSFFDEVHGLDWFQNLIETRVFGLLHTAPKLPQNEKGIALLTHEIEKACMQGVVTGFLSPGVWNGPSLGQIKTGDFLSKGFHVHVQPLADQAQVARDKRVAPNIQILAKGSGSIHFVDIVITFER